VRIEHERRGKELASCHEELREAKATCTRLSEEKVEAFKDHQLELKRLRDAADIT
jgi:hypothetical protein